MVVVLAAYRATIGLKYANNCYSPTSKNNFFLLHLAFKTFQFELLALVMLLIQFLVFFIFGKCIVFYQKANSMKTIMFLLSAKILHHGNPTCLIPAIAFIISSWGIFYFMKKRPKLSIHMEPFTRILLEAFILENTLVYHYKWAKNLPICGDIHQHPGPK